MEKKRGPGNYYQTIKDAGYKYVKYIGNAEHVLLNTETGKQEVFFSNKNHASWGLFYKNTHLEFACEYNPNKS